MDNDEEVGMNFSRQEELYQGGTNNDVVSIIGVGATGSWVGLLLAKLGVKNIILFDNDIIELHNVPNQLYSKSDIDKFKVNMCKKYMKELGAMCSHIDNYNMEVDDNVMEDIIPDSTATFCLVDSMAVRKELFEAAMKASTRGAHHYWIETRMGLTGYRIYLIDLSDDYQVAEYRKTLYNDEEAEVSACGHSQSIVSTAMQCASHAVGLWLAKLNNAEYVPNEIIFDVHSSFIMSKKFEPKE